MSIKTAPASVGSHSTQRRNLRSTQRRSRGLTIAVVLLTVITLGLAGWLAYLLLVPEENALSDDVAQVVQEYRDAWNTYDGATFLGLVTADFMFYDSVGTPGDNAEQTAVMITSDLKSGDWSVERLGPAQMVGDENTVKVSELDVTNYYGAVAGEGVSVLTLVKQDGTWKVQQHAWDGPVNPGGPGLGLTRASTLWAR